MRRWLALKRIPYWPLGAYVLCYIQRVIGVRFNDIAPRHTIREALCPVLLAHGTEDEMVPPSEAREIYGNRRNEQVSLLLIPGSHDRYGEMERHLGTVIGFLDAHTAASASRRRHLGADSAIKALPGEAQA